MNNKTTQLDPLQELFMSTPSVEEEVDFKKLMIVEDILKLMKEIGMNRKELADKMGVVPSRISSMLNGTNNMTIETLVRAAEAVGGTLEQTIIAKGKKIKWIGYDEKSTHDAFKVIKKKKLVSNFSHMDQNLTEPTYNYERQPA